MEIPLHLTLDRLDADSDHCRFVAEPEGEGWTLLADLLADPHILAGWFDAARRAHHGARDAAGAFVAGWIAEVLLDGVATALQDEQRTWPLVPTATWLHRHEAGWLDGLAVTARAMRALPSDPAASHHDVELVADVGELRRSLATEAVAVLSPIFSRLRTMAPFGIAGMWGSAADAIGVGAACRAARRGQRPEPAFDDAMLLVDELAVARRAKIVRPTLRPEQIDVVPAVLVRKGTCCLFYKTAPDEPSEPHLCGGCPLRFAERQSSIV